MSNLSYKNAFASTNPIIFIGSAVFSVITVLISCRRPGKLAGKVSPVEAVRYTEQHGIKKNVRKSSHTADIHRMAFANLGRSRKRTVLVVLSLSLAVVLLQLTFTFTNGFDMDKYLRQFVVSDFIVGNSSYFQTGNFFNHEMALPEAAISEVSKQGGITDGGRIYGQTGTVQEWITEEYYRKSNGYYNDKETLDTMLQYEDRNEKGLVTSQVNLYGMEKYPLDLLNLREGDLSPLYDPDQNAIAAVYFTDDYDALEKDSHWAKIGDKVTVRYVDKWEYYDINTDRAVENPEDLDSDNLDRRIAESHEVTYNVTALVTLRHSMSYRYYGSDQFVLNSEVFKRDSGTSDIMTYLYNTTQEANESMEQFLMDYTENTDPTIDFESKQSYMNEFDGFRNMFLLLGGVLSSVIGLIGVLNFLNAIVTSILVRRQEFAMLQSIGMTGRQLIKMLVLEGLFYVLLAIGLSLILSILSGPLLNKAMSSMFWFFTYRFSLLPVAVVTPVFLILGFVLPLIAYHFSARKTIVERLRVIE
jgi:putative ABC transport system permease protein